MTPSIFISPSLASLGFGFGGAGSDGGADEIATALGCLDSIGGVKKEKARLLDDGGLPLAWAEGRHGGDIVEARVRDGRCIHACGIWLRSPDRAIRDIAQMDRAEDS